MTPLERMCEAYWEAFRQGYFKVGGRPEDYPAWKSAPKAVKEETRRCMRYAAETMRQFYTDGLWEELFPEGMVLRGQDMTPNDTGFVQQTKIAEIGEKLG